MSLIPRFLAVATLFAGLATSTASPAAAEVAATPAVHRFVSSTRSYEGNAFLIDAAEGWVLVDALMLKSDVLPIIAMVKASGKPLLGILLTHPHLDHAGGLSPIRQALGAVPIHATRTTRDALLLEHQQALKTGWIDVFGSEFDRSLAEPDTLLQSGTVLRLGALRIRADDVGAVDAANNTVFRIEGSNLVFAGDALVSSYAVYVGEGHSRSMLDAYQRLESMLGARDRVLPGHGGEMLAGRLLADNRRQVETMRREVSSSLDALGDRPVAELDLPALSARVSAELQAYSSYGMPLPHFVRSYTLPGLLHELVAERGTSGATTPQ